MERISFSQLKLMSLTSIMAGECLEVTGDGRPRFYVVVNPEVAMGHRVRSICSQIDASRRGRTIRHADSGGQSDEEQQPGAD